MSRRLRVVAVVAPLLAAASFCASGAAASMRDVTYSANWAGYAVTGLNPATAAATSFSVVSGTWVEPAATCTEGRQTWSSFWVGLGGFSPTSQALEQIGTEADCSQHGATTYSVWWELVPAALVRTQLKVFPGNTINAVVVVSGNRVTMRLRNLTRHTVFTKTATADALDVASAEWVAEAPSTCDDAGHCQVLPLTNFGTVPFTSAAAIGDGHTGSIADGAWTATGIELITPGQDPSIPVTAGPGAIPSDIGPDGGSFAVTYADSISRPTG
jgi:hypothetical protein